MTAAAVIEALRKQAHADDAQFLQRFFKTGPGAYGEGDVFIGVRVPTVRRVCREFNDLPIADIQNLLDSPIHEARLAALLILVKRYARGDEPIRQRVFDVYIRNVRQGRVNNWDLVDASAPYITGAHLMDRSRSLLEEFARSDQIWERRVAIVSTFYFLRHGDPTTTLQLADILADDPHDLIQKAVGWMLREMGKRVDQALLIGFLEQHAATMPRTMLRYAIERLDSAQKAHFMAAKKQLEVADRTDSRAY